MEILVCTVCGEGVAADSLEQEFACHTCGTVFNCINGVPCFVAKELEQFTEVPPAEREKFLEMKRIAYSDDSLVSRMYNHYHRYAARKRSESGEKLLTVDIGFGIGEHYPFITEAEKAAGAFIGVDLDRFKLEHFSVLHSEIPVLQASAFRLPLRDGAVDAVQLLATLEHFSVADLDRVVAESLRVLKPGGLLIVCYPAEGSFLLKLCQMFMHGYLRIRTGFDLDKGQIHSHLVKAVEIQCVLRNRADLQRIETCHYPLNLKWLNCVLFVNELYRKNQTV